MALENNMPTYTYVRYTGMQIVYGDNIYTIQDSHSNKKYLYWSITNPYILEGVNVRKNQTVGTYLVIINDNGISTMPPQIDITINFDGNNPGLIQDKIFGIYDTVDGYGDRFVAIETDIEGIKQIVGEGGSDSDHNSIWEKISEIEQTAENIDLSVKNVERIFADNKETLELRENLNKSIIDFNSNLGIFKSEISGYFKDNLINDEEKISIETHISILDASKSEVILNVNKVVLIAESENQTTIVNSLNGAKTKFITAVDNLKTIINTAISDNTIVPSEITIITDLFAKCNVAVNQLKNTCDEVIFLGAGGSISEELARIGIRSDEISLKVSKTEEKINTTLSIEKLALSGQVKDVENAHESLSSAMKTIFTDGEVSNAESIIISEKISELAKEKVDIDNKYDSLYGNKHLSSASKNTLKVQYDIYVNKHNVTIAYINEVISDTFVNEAEINNVSVHMNEYLSELGILHQKMNQAMDDIALNQQRAELQQAKDDLQGNINDVDNKVNDLNGYIDGTFNDNVLDTAERQAIKNNLDNLAREKSDIDNQYNQLINSRFLDGVLKTNYTTSYNNFISKYNSLVSLINGILNKQDLINNTDRDNMNSSNAELNESIGVFIRLSNEVIEYIARKESEYVKDLLDKDIVDVDNKVNDLTNDINSTFKDNIIDESERKAIALNLKDLELQKIDIDNQYNQLVLSTYLDGELKVEFVNKYNALNVKYAELLEVMNFILNKTGLITDIDRTNLDNAKDSFGLSIGEYSTTVNKVIEYIGKKQSESAVGDFNSQLGALNDKVDSILDDVGGALADNIIDETERIAIAQSLKELENEFAKNSAEYLKVYNNVNLVGDIKTQLNTIYKAYENKHNQLVQTINYLINKVGLIDDTDRTRLNTSYAEYKEALKNYVSISYDAIDSITNKGIDDAKNLFDKELGDLTTSLGNLEETMNGVFKDGVLSEAEKASIRQNLYTLELEKADIDKSYSTIYNNSNLTGAPKTELKTSYDSYITSYNNLVKVINDILDKVGIVDGTDKAKMDSAFASHKTNLSNFKGKYNTAIDSITSKSVNDAKESLQKEINDLNNSLGDLEDTMNNAFKDGVLSDAEKLAIKQNLQTISNEKADVDKQYLTVYGNVDLVGDAKTNLKNAYDDYVSKYNSLVNVINNILNKVGLVDSTDQTNLNNAFSNYRTSSGVYSQRMNEAVDSIAQKKADDAESSSKKYTESEIKIVNDAINLKVSQSEYNSNNELVNNKFSEINQNLYGITSTVSDVKNIADGAMVKATEVEQTSHSISNRVDSIEGDYVKGSQITQLNDSWTARFETTGYNLFRNSSFKNEFDYWAVSGNPSDGTVSILDSIGDFAFKDENVNTVQIFMQNKTEKEFGVKQSVNLTVGSVYSIDFYVNGVDCGWGSLILEKNGTVEHVVHFNPLENGGGMNKWVKVEFPFTATTVAYTIKIALRDAGNNGHMWITKPNLVEGYAKAWSPNPNELYDGIIRLDKEGIKIYHSDSSKGIYDSKGITYYSSKGIKTSAIKDGKFSTIDNDGNVIGFTGKSIWEGTDTHLTALEACYGSTVGLGATISGNGDTTIPLVVASKGMLIGDIWMQQGLNIMSPRTFGKQTFFRRNIGIESVTMEQYAGDDDLGYIVGSEGINMGVIHDNKSSIGFCIEKNLDYWTKCLIQAHTDLNMNNFYILNFKTQFSLTDTYSLDNGIEIDEEKQIANIDVSKATYRLNEENKILKEENELLKTEQAKQNDEIITNMVANTEVFEMVLGMIPMTINKNSNNGGDMAMVEVYATLIIKGVKTIDQVPLIIRGQVEQRLKELEVQI